MNSSSVTTSNPYCVERRQFIVFIRHGIALHNIIDERTGEACNYRDPYFFDSPLLEDRIDNVIQMGKNVKEWFHKHHRNIELIVTSPLTRCIQTTVIAFGPSSNSNLELPIMCKEVVREAFGKHYPDKRREKSVLMVSSCIYDIDIEEKRKSNENLFFVFFFIVNIMMQHTACVFTQNNTSSFEFKKTRGVGQ